MIYKTEELGIEWDGRSRIPASNRSGLFWSVFSDWWYRFGLDGDGLMIGEEYPKAAELKKEFFEKYPPIRKIDIASLVNADFIWNIIYPFPHSPYFENGNYDWIICQAVLEHVIDPPAAIRNMNNVLKKGGRIYLHSHGPNFAFHRHPLDCYRFYRDAVIGMAELADMEIDDLLWTENHWFAIFRRR